VGKSSPNMWDTFAIFKKVRPFLSPCMCGQDLSHDQFFWHFKEILVFCIPQDQKVAVSNSAGLQVFVSLIVLMLRLWTLTCFFSQKMHYAFGIKISNLNQLEHFCYFYKKKNVFKITTLSPKKILQTLFF
jgi:hypothetical protein